MKRVIICYYSCTGNTKKACRYLKNNLKGADTELFDITGGTLPELDKYDFVGLATFTDWNDAPYFIQKFIDRLPRQKNKPTFLFSTCAGISGRTLNSMQAWCKEKGFKVLASFTLKAPGSYPPNVARGRLVEHYPTPANMKAFNYFISNLNRLLSCSEYDNLKEVKIKIGLINLFLPKFPRDKSKKAMGPKYVDPSLCNLCGNCKKVCPYQAIEIVKGPVFDEDKCYGCWSCFNHCASKAIYTGKLKGKGHYSGPPDLYNKKLGAE